jgi:hypothetical protein
VEEQQRERALVALLEGLLVATTKRRARLLRAVDHPEQRRAHRVGVTHQMKP